MKGGLRLVVTAEILGECRESRATEGKVRATCLRCEETGDYIAVEAKRGHRVTDALLHSRQDRANRPPQLLERCAPVRTDRAKVVVYCLRLGAQGALGIPPLTHERHCPNCPAALGRNHACPRDKRDSATPVTGYGCEHWFMTSVSSRRPRHIAARHRRHAPSRLRRARCQHKPLRSIRSSALRAPHLALPRKYLEPTRRTGRIRIGSWQ